MTIPLSQLPLTLAHCTFEKSTTTPTLIFDIAAIILSIGTLVYFRKGTDRFWLRVLVVAIGVLIFELFTGPMWLNQRMGFLAYLYLDVSWILTLGWTAIILGSILLVDRWKSKWSASKRFPLYLALILPIVMVAEAVVVNVGIRSYSHEVQEATSGITVAQVPIEILYYVPVFASLVITFYKYWSIQIDRIPLVPIPRQRWLRGIGLAFAAVFLFELMIEPMVENRGFPAWSYLYRDISLIMTLVWIFIIGAGAVVVERFFIHWAAWQRFMVAIGIMALLALIAESWLIVNGYRVYGDAATENFTGFTTPITGVAVEVAFAIPCYLALMVCFVRYWEINLDNKL